MLDADDPILAALRMSAEELTPFAEGRSAEAARARIRQAADWVTSVTTQNHDGVTLTPVLVRYLAGSQDLSVLTGELDRLREETRRGRFDAGCELQRELEFRRFAAESRRQRDWPEEPQEVRLAFDALTRLPPASRPEPFELDETDRLEAKRTAYEAHGLLRFLRDFRAGTRRPVVVLGNDRYGRIFVVEPLEPYLDGFDIHYERVPSHGSMRLTVPYHIDRFWRNGFAPDFVRRLSAEAPHLVLVDVCSPRATEDYTKIPRGLRDLVNWFMVFNHLRTGGDRSRYETVSSLPPHQLDELQLWHEFEVVARQIAPWVDPGEPYAVTHWAPELMTEVLMGDLVVPARPARPSEQPQVVVTNPGFYRTVGEDLPDYLRRTHAYHFNDPEKRVAARIAGGWGDHGFETRVEGHTTDEYVAAIQRQVGLELSAMEAETAS